MKKPLAILVTAFSLSLGLAPALGQIPGDLVLEAHAHPGRTDSNGGHRDTKIKADLEAITITAAVIRPICIQTASAPMQAVLLLVVPALQAVLPTTILLKHKHLQKQKRTCFPPAGSMMNTAGSIRFPKIPIMLTE